MENKIVWNKNGMETPREKKPKTWKDNPYLKAYVIEAIINGEEVVVIDPETGEPDEEIQEYVKAAKGEKQSEK